MKHFQRRRRLIDEKLGQYLASRKNQDKEE